MIPSRPASAGNQESVRGGSNESLTWWQRAVIYQVYPRSFQDTNGDGIGDLEGIRRRLDYLNWLGIEAMWISPFYSSPMADFGYDVADFCDVDPIFGTLSDFDRLIAEAHTHNIKVILDYVPNHTSDRHPWFLESRSSRSNPKRDWYIWRDSKSDGSAPSNWISNFGGSAWEWDDRTRQFYYHAFLKQQPDLNWRNPEVRRAMEQVLRFWMARGVDGFRADAITNLIEDRLLRDDPPNLNFRADMSEKKRLQRVFTDDRPETHECVAAMRAILDEAGDRVLIGEAHLPIARVMAYYGNRRPGFNLPFNFILLHTPWNARNIEAAIDQYTTLLPEGDWGNWVLGNHDTSRVASRIGEAQARVAAVLLMTLKGTPFVYNGDELGLGDAEIPDELVQDPVSNSLGRARGRDPQRTPMPWAGAVNGGFTDGDPWLPLGADRCTRNVAAMRADQTSILTLYRRLISLRRSTPALLFGSYEPAAYKGNLLGYYRRAGGQELLILLNVGCSEQHVKLESPGRILISTHLDRTGARPEPICYLRPNEGIVVEII